MNATQLADRLDVLPIGRFHRRLIAFSGLGWMFDAMDVGLVSFVIAALVVQWKLQPAEAGFISSAGFAGMFVGAAVAGTLADRFGRRLIFQSTMLIYAIATGLCALAGNLGQLLVMRFLVGLGLGGELPVASTLVSELSPARRRGTMIVLLESFWAYGWTLAALIGYLIIPYYGWQVAFLIGALPALYVLVLRRKIPESPRFLMSQGREREAEMVVSEIERETFDSNRPATAVAEPPRTGSIHLPIDSSVSSWDRFKRIWSPGLARRSLMLWLLWFGIVFSYYGVFTWLPSLLSQQFPLVRGFEYTLLITLAQIPGYFSAAYLVEKVGRKPTLVVYLLICAIGAFFFRGASTEVEILVWGCVISFFNLGAWGVVYTYTPELYPTAVRGTGAGSAAAFGRIGGIIGPYVVGLLLPTWQAGTSGIFLMFAAVFLVISMVVLVLGEETRGGALEQIAG